MKRGVFALGLGSLINLYGLHSFAVYFQVIVLGVFGLMALKFREQKPERFMIPALVMFI
ncbi:MAG: hypothetical protein KA715_08705 [Xanthomonadaceae bacterium]|nr:hypothetical protein [Xanthomonadaceae bacterium]